MNNKKTGIELFNGDCLENMKLIKTESVDLIVSDVPYRIKTGGSPLDDLNQPKGIFGKKQQLLDKNELKGKWIKKGDKLAATGKLFEHNEIKFKDFLPEMFRVLKNKSHCYLMVNNSNLNSLINEALKVGFKEQNILVWKKQNCTPNKYYMKDLEFIIMLRKGPAKNINNMGSKAIIQINNIIGNKTHPTEKPVALNEMLILNSSQKGETVLDPFMGSGSCGVACMNTGRNFIGIEMDKEYFKTAKKRIEEALP